MKNKLWVLVLIAVSLAIYFFTKDSSEATVAEQVTIEEVVVEEEATEEEATEEEATEE
jgi:hypothetical protein